jgi:acetyl-CoA acetyltransferase
MSRPKPVAIAGIGYSPFARSLDAEGDALAVVACREALADCGLVPGDLDGIATYLGAYEHAPLCAVAPALGLDETRLRLRSDVMAFAPAAATAVIEAIEAVERGQCEAVLAYKSNKWKRGQPPGAPAPGEEGPLQAGGPQQFTLPYGHAMTAQWLALWAMRHFHVYGTRHEHLGHIAVTFRRHAGLNARAVLRDPMTLGDYLASPWISEPFRRLDCDYPIDGAGALVVTTLERARDLRQPPIYVLGAARRDGEMEEWEMWPDLTTMASKGVSDRVWASSGLSPRDVDVAEVYDGFSFLALCWLEDAGFCKKGEGGPFAASGAIALGGSLPTNTHGGNLSEGRSHGIGHILEAVQQLRGTAGPRQVPGARVAFAANGGGPIAGAMVLASELP